jgi:hypothetical protein
MYKQVPTRQLAAELAELQEMRSSIRMFSAAEALESNPSLTAGLLHLNPLTFREFDVDSSVLQDLADNMERLMPAEPEQRIKEWLQEKRDVSVLQGSAVLQFNVCCSCKQELRCSCCCNASK